MFVRDVAAVEDSSDIQTGIALVNGRRTVYIPVTKRADASTVTVVNLVKENLAKFQADPTAYEPQFGGYCAWAVSQGYVAPGDPGQWKIVDGRLYLNFNARAKELWEADQADAIERGNANWPGVLTKNQDNP